MNSFYTFTESIGVNCADDDSPDVADKGRKSDMENQNHNLQILEEKKNWSIFMNCRQFSLFLFFIVCIVLLLQSHNILNNLVEEIDHFPLLIFKDFHLTFMIK